MTEIVANTPGAPVVRRRRLSAENGTDDKQKNVKSEIHKVNII